MQLQVEVAPRRRLRWTRPTSGPRLPSGGLEQARAVLQSEHDRHDTSLSELHERLAQLIAPHASPAPGDQERLGEEEVSGLFVRRRRLDPPDIALRIDADTSLRKR